MKVNRKALKNVVEKGDGSIVAQCPACAEKGSDNKGEHLIVFKSGKFGCIAAPDDKKHNRRILALAGDGKSGWEYSITVKPLILPESKTISILGRLGRQSESPMGKTTSNRKRDQSLEAL